VKDDVLGFPDLGELMARHGGLWLSDDAVVMGKVGNRCGRLAQKNTPEEISGGSGQGAGVALGEGVQIEKRHSNEYNVKRPLRTDSGYE
jgi:hypothetical protein